MIEQSYVLHTEYSWAIAMALMSVMFSLSMHLRPIWTYRKISSALNACLIGVSTGLLIVTIHPLAAVGLFIVQVYRLFSILRIVSNRLNPDMLNRKTLRTELVLSVWLLGILFVEHFVMPHIYYESAFVLLVCAQLLFAAIFYRHVRTMRNETSVVLPKKFTSDADLPTITVAVPARNETTELTDCLQSILHSTYPKLEVLVLDDCSQVKTSDIIRTFAHRGVRFIQGSAPSSAWIAKNHAYSQLLDEATGEYILFCGTDVRFEPNSLRHVIEVMLHSHVNMVSVLPERSSTIDQHFLLQPMRYWRELAILHPFDKTPPVLSTCWVAKRAMLVKHGGFKALRKAIRPERQIAKGVAQEGHYRFLHASAGLGITSVKALRAQWATAVRTRYPEHHNRPESILFTSLWQLILLFGPMVSIFVGFILNNAVFVGLSGLAFLYLLATHYEVYKITTGKSSIRPFMLYPTSVLLEIVVINYSMWAYEFSEVIWKGRNICLPVLQTSLRLPKLS